MPETEYHANLLGTDRKVATCAVCADVINLRADDHALFAVADGDIDQLETPYHVSPLCSPECSTEYVQTVLGGAQPSFPNSGRTW